MLGYLVEINQFLKTKLKLNLHPDKISIRKLNWGIDYVGYVVTPIGPIPRKKTVTRILKNLPKAVDSDQKNLESCYQSWLGYLSHAHSYDLQLQLEELMDYATNPFPNPDNETL